MSFLRWNNIVEENKESTVYHRYEWGKVLEKVHSHKVFFLEEERGTFPIAYIKSFLFGNRLISMPFADYGGPVGELNSLLDKLEKLAIKLNPDFIEVRTPLEEHRELLIESGYEERVDYCTFKLDLERGEEKIWREMEKRTRNGITRALKEGLGLRRAKNLEGLRAFYHLYLKTMKRLGSPPQPYIFFEALWKEFARKDLMRIYFVVFDSKLISAMLFFTHNNKVHYAYSCSLYEYRKKRGNDFLLWNVIRNFSYEGFESFDFGRTRFNSGVYKYKRGWGGKEVSMPYYYKFYKKKLEERQEVKYAKIAQLWSKYMPESLAKIVGPWIIKQVG
jgi:FemAB-related protein (PEP-CTERM system-associated)